MIELDDVLARARRPGRFVERKRFTLSREKAVEKQREFALRHPSQSVLEIIGAAVFAGAHYIAVDTKDERLLVAWVGGKPITEGQLHDLLDYLFVDRSARAHRHLAQLAIGVNALLQRKPRSLCVETGDGTTAVRLELDRNGRASLGEVEDPVAGTYLLAEFGGGWMRRFLGESHTPEKGLVEERCLYTPVPILLNGTAPFGYRASHHIEIFGARRQKAFSDAEGRRGVVAVHQDYVEPGFRMVVGGVWINTHPLPGLAARPLVGVICDDGLRKTADQSDIVEDAALVRLMHAVQPHATALLKSVDRAYTAPELPPLVEEKAAGAGPPAVPEVAALPDRIPQVGARHDTDLDTLSALADRGVPVFWCTPEVAHAVAPGADPLAFPHPLLILSPGQVRTLVETTAVRPHPITTRTDLEFVRQVSTRTTSERSRSTTVGGGVLTVRLHVDGAIPCWGDPGGVPFLVVRGQETQHSGAVIGREVVSGGETLHLLPSPLRLPGVSLVLNGLDGLGTDLARHARSTAAQLAAEHGAPHLLAAALGELVVPQMHDEPEGPVLGLFLPPGLEPSLLSLPITSEPTFATTDLLALLGTNETARFSSAADVEPLKAFERVLGHGHLGHPELDGQVVVGVGRLGSKWMPLLPSHWADPTFHAAVVVGATLQPELAIPEGWKADQPFPGVVRAIRKGVGASCLDGGLDALFDLLRTHHAEGSWGATPSTVDVPRSRDLGRLAMFHLAAARGELDVPLTPTDGGTARTLAEIAEEPRARWVLRGGIAINEPWTFAVTRDELAVLDPTGQVGLRFDDSPASYQADDTNWLVRRQLRAGGLRGWIGLRLPFDPTASVLIQTPRGLEGIDDLDSRVPCHGILHPDTQTDHIDLGVATQVLLVGLEVYQALAHQLRGGSLDDARRGEAEHYARRYVRLAESDGSPNRTVVALAAHLGMVLSAKRAISPAGLGGLAERLDRALGGGGAGVATVRAESLPRKHLVVPAKSESTDDHVVLLVNADHPLGARALAGDQRAREAVALELARQACQHLRVDLLAVQVSLLASRLG